MHAVFYDNNFSEAMKSGFSKALMEDCHLRTDIERRRNGILDKCPSKHASFHISMSCQFSKS